MVLSLCAIILLFSLLALLVVPARFYKKNSLLMQKFCLRMIFVEKFRKLYTLGLLMALIMAHAERTWCIDLISAVSYLLQLPLDRTNFEVGTK